MKQKLLLIIIICSLTGCLQEQELSASATAQSTASDVQTAHRETVSTLDQLNDKVPNEANHLPIASIESN